MAKEAFREGQAQDLKLEMLRKVHIFEDLSEDELRDALKYMQVRDFRRNEYLFFEEEAEPGVYILIDGLIKLLKETHDARIVIVRLVYPGDIFGWIEWGKKVPRNTYTAKAMVESKTLYISNKDFINLSIK
ncbi:MAG: cyclic nucleotide-binding domain-containing protein, partial [Aquificota bacterium]